jgi:hypothetical protein
MKKFIRLLGGYPDIQSAIDALKNSDNLDLKNRVLTEGIKHLFSTISSDDILKMGKNGVEFRGKPFSEEQMLQIKSEALSFQGSLLWNVLKTDIRYQINKKIFEEAADVLALVSGKAALYIFGIINERLEKLK